MDIRHLRTFVAIAETLSFSKAAERLNLSQPPVSLQIKHLEEELGVKLIERGGKREITLSPAGEIFLVGARQTIQAIERARQNTLLFAQGRAGQIDVGYTDEFLFSLLPEAISAFNSKSTGVSLNLSLKSSFEIVDLVSGGDLDVGFICLPIPRSAPRVAVRRLASTDIVLVTGRGHPLAKKKTVWLREINDTPIILPPQQLISGFCAQVMRLLTQSGVTPSIMGTTDSTQIAYEMVARGAGVMLASHSSLPPNRSDTSLLKLRDHVPRLELGMVYRHRNTMLPVIESFVATVEETFSEPANRNTAQES